MESETKHDIVISDILDCLKNIPDESVQLIIADPPYNIDIADWDRYDDYIEWASQWIHEAYRVLKKTGNIVIFGGFQFENAQRADLLELVHYIRSCTEFKLVNVIIWYYKSGISARRFFSNRHEEIMWFTKSNKYIFNLDDVRIKYAQETLELYKRDKRLKLENLLKGKNPTNVWEISRLNSNSKERVGHPTQKPQQIIERIVKSMSNKQDTVLDMFAGSGVTVKVCIENDRNSILCDKDIKLNSYVEKQLNMISKKKRYNMNYKEGSYDSKT
ncbi:MAG: site-specific DNA-methyltransferase [Clostridiales bacterium]|nr:site-specific DNA-methyltransferase [Clostridiales bacterium]